MIVAVSLHTEPNNVIKATLWHGDTAYDYYRHWNQEYCLETQEIRFTNAFECKLLNAYNISLHLHSGTGEPNIKIDGTLSNDDICMIEIEPNFEGTDAWFLTVKVYKKTPRYTILGYSFTITEDTEIAFRNARLSVKRE